MQQFIRHTEIELISFKEYPYWRELLPGAALVVHGVVGTYIYLNAFYLYNSGTKVLRVQMVNADGLQKDYPAGIVSIVIKNIKASF